jgi:hypothetical protein
MRFKEAGQPSAADDGRKRRSVPNATSLARFCDPTIQPQPSYRGNFFALTTGTITWPSLKTTSELKQNLDPLE